MTELKWVLREVLFDDGQPIAHREPQQDRRAALDEVHQSMHEEYHGTMARNEMIRLAREAGASPLHGGEVALFGAAAIERFAELVAEREALKRQKKFVECMCGLCKLEEPQ